MTDIGDGHPLDFERARPGSPSDAPDAVGLVRSQHQTNHTADLAQAQRLVREMLAARFNGDLELMRETDARIDEFVLGAHWRQFDYSALQILGMAWMWEVRDLVSLISDATGEEPAQIWARLSARRAERDGDSM